MNNPLRILQTLDRHLTAPAEITLFGRAALALGYTKHPALLRMLELEALRDLGENAYARIYIGFDKHLSPEARKENE